MTTYIYALHCPIADSVRYIGKTVNPEKRLKSHLSAAKNFSYKHHTSAWLRKLLANGLEPRMVILETVAEGEKWQDAERSWIAQAPSKGWNLTNSTAGGEGLDYICPEAAAAYRANLSAAMSELWNRPERREEARQRSIASWADPEVNARRKASQEAARATAETQARFVAAAIEINSRPEVKAKRSRSLRAAWADPERKEEWVAAITTPDVKKRQSESKIAIWRDPEGRAKMLASYTPERRAHQAKLLADPERQAKIDAARNSPEYKAKRAATIRAKNARTPEQEIVWREERLAKRRDKRAAQKAAKLAATTSAPYTESS